MPIALHWDQEVSIIYGATHLCRRSKVAGDLKISNVKNFAIFNFVCTANIRNIRKFAPYENFPPYGI